MNVSDAPSGASLLTHRRLLALAVPVILSNLSTPLLGIVNTAVIGRLGDATQLAAVALGAVIFDLLFWAFGFLRMSTAGLSAQALGAGDSRELGAAFRRALLIAIAIGLAILLARNLIADAALAFMAPGEDVARAARAYIEARIWVAPVALANYVILGSMVGRARTDLGLAVQVAINAANVALSLLFVSGLGMGVAGAGYASLIAEILGCLIGLALQARDGLLAGAQWREFRARAAIWRTLAVNRDIFLRTLAILVGLAFFTRQGSQAGEAVLAANAVLYNIFLLGSYLLDGFATATEQTAGRAVGARDRSAFSSATRLGAVWCVAIGAAASLAFYLLGGLAVDAISTSPAVREAARQYLPFAALAPLAGAPAFLLDGIFIGATWTRAMRDAMALTFIATTLIYLATKPLGNTGLWLAFLAFLALRGVAQMAFYPALERRTFSRQPG